MTTNKDDLALWDQELRDRGGDPLFIVPSFPRFIESGVSVDGTYITVQGAKDWVVTFRRSAVGGPVIAVPATGDWAYWVNNHADFGDFTEDKWAWVQAYYAPSTDDDGEA